MFVVNHGELNLILVCEFNLILVREFYANWNAHHVEMNSGFVTNSRVHFSIEALNNFLGTPNCDHTEFLDMVERHSYRDICHTLCE